MTSEVEIEVRDDGTLSLGGALTFDSTPVVFERLDDRIRSADTRVTIDLDRIERIDSSGLALLLEWQAVVMQRDNSLQIHNAPDSLIKLAHLCEADKLLDMSERIA